MILGVELCPWMSVAISGHRGTTSDIRHECQLHEENDLSGHSA